MNTAIGDALERVEMLAIEVAEQLPEGNPASDTLGKLRLALTRAHGFYLRSIDGTAAAVTPRVESPEFPLETLPEWLGVYVADVAASLQVPVDMPGAFALGALATAGARLGTINPHGDWIEPLNLFVALVAPPGTKKSATEKAMMFPVREFERDLFERTKPERRAAEIERQRLEQELEDARRQPNWERVSELTEQLEETPPPVAPQLSTDDVTAQRLAGLLAQHKCMAIISAEPSIFPTMLGRWANGKASTELDVFLKGQAGDEIKVDRQGKPSESVEAPRLTLAIALQPAALKALAGAETAGRGLLARFLYANAPDTRGTARLQNGRPIPPSHRSDFDAGMRRLLDAAPLGAPLTLTTAASKIWVRFCDQFEGRLAPGGDMRDLHGWGEKFRGNVARITGLLHLAEGNGGRQVSAETVEAALCLGRWLEAHALQAFGTMNLRADVREANSILEVVIRLERQFISRRDLHQHMKDRNGFRRVSDLDRGLRLLVSHGWLTARESARGSPGRPRSDVFDVNPLVHSEGFEGVSGGLK